jgi:acetyltransferase-like isoleucine patch superfamily enzyme
VVTRDVPAGETVVGMPARRIGTRRGNSQGGSKPRSDA